MSEKLTFWRCGSCRSLNPIQTQKCRMCGAARALWKRLFSRAK